MAKLLPECTCRFASRRARGNRGIAYPETLLAEGGVMPNSLWASWPVVHRPFVQRRTDQLFRERRQGRQEPLATEALRPYVCLPVVL